MSGHSHWANVKRKKMTGDQTRGELFSKCSRAIALAAREGKDPELNAALRKAIEDAKKINMPKENIKRAIERGAGGVGEGGLEETILEGYGPSGVAIMLRIVTDNKNRTLSEIRRVFEKAGGSLGEKGCAAYIFDKDPDKPLFEVEIGDQPEAEKILALMERLDDHPDVQESWANFDIVTG